MYEKIKENEYIVINFNKITARIIEIYSVPDAFDRIFLIKYPDNGVGYAFESQITPLDQMNQFF